MAHSDLVHRASVNVVVFATSLLAPLAHAESAKPENVNQLHGTTEPEPSNEKPAVSLFINLEWRVYGLGQHVSHGPALAAGVSLLDDHLRIGLGGLARPGPFNPTTFDVTLEDGTEYRGQSTLSLRNDGMMAGLHLSYSTALPFAQALAFQVPVTFGYGGFGYYLTGDDRDTPDGRRVSEWEDELFDGRDAYIGFVLDGAVRIRYQPRALPWLMPYAGVGFTMVPGFSTVVRDDYWGVSGILGLEIGIGR